METLRTQTGTTKASFTNRIQKMEEKNLNIEDKIQEIIQEINISVQENFKSKNFSWHKTVRKSGTP